MLRFKRTAGVLALAALLAAPWQSAGDIATIKRPVTTGFGTYSPVSLAELTPSVPDLTVAGDLSGVAYLDRFSELQQGEPLELLAANHFVAIPGRFKQVHDLYNQAREMEVPIFVTTDAMLHSFHIIYDYALRILETDLFQHDLQALNQALLEAVDGRSSDDPALAEELRRAAAFVNVARRLADPGSGILPETADLVDAELELVGAHAGPEYSPILGYREDYTQYVPRGHYTRSEELENYFRSMMWYGRMGFRLRPDSTPEGIEKGRSETRMALNLAGALVGLTVSGEPAVDVWERIYRPTVFFVGEADDLTFYDYAELAETVYGKPVQELSPDEIADPALLDEFIEQAAGFRKPRINSSLLFDTQDPAEATQGFRVMGQRFIPDSYMFWQLVHPNVYNRLMPRGLDVMAILGSEEAERILDEVYQETNNPDYQVKLDSLKAEFSGLPPEAWAENLYYNWLYCLAPLLEEKSAGYPRFMRGRAWTHKSLSTALGSWAQLRHDTILYAKQSYTLETSMPLPPGPAAGYVEPQPAVFARLAALARYMRAGLEAHGTLPAEIAWRLAEFESLQLSLKLIAEKHLTNKPLTQTENEVIISIGEVLEKLVTFPPDGQGRPSWESDTDDEMAVIADVHTDPNTGRVLEVGVGYPLALYVIVPGADGPRIALGGMFSYYEFKHPMDDRLTDEAWQEMLHTDQAPTLPEWAEDYLAVEGMETVTEHMTVLAGPPLVTGIRLEVGSEVVSAGETLEVWLNVARSEGYNVRFWADGELLGETGLLPDPLREGVVSASVSTAGWPSGVVRAEVLWQGEPGRSTFLEIASGTSLSPADLDGDGLVSLFDLVELLQRLSQGRGADVNGDGGADIFDLLEMLHLLCGAQPEPAGPGVRLSALGGCGSDTQKDPDTRG
ncbi:MAG: DUF3160 domain-containing protein, partial [Candidatus Glassbacteria bacterium]|nr:DUF3160 domain-containing protein [Candidatus Glassbacteria bacterium]